MAGKTKQAQMTATVLRSFALTLLRRADEMDWGPVTPLWAKQERRYGKYNPKLLLHKPTSKRACPGSMAPVKAVKEAFTKHNQWLTPLERKAVVLRFGIRTSKVGSAPRPRQAYEVAQAIGLNHPLAQTVTRRAVRKLGVAPSKTNR